MPCVKLRIFYYLTKKISINQPITLQIFGQARKREKERKNKPQVRNFKRKSVENQGKQEKKVGFFNLSLKSIFLKHFSLFFMLKLHVFMMNCWLIKMGQERESCQINLILSYVSVLSQFSIFRNKTTRKEFIFLHYHYWLNFLGEYQLMILMFI